ncbi:hypothetical protein VE00_10215 [Pseudogymnoascus sp. WSF 3629]|nr:hypothetical protein VE00_10215 [Pseudogymnoascus sp. WSF 3629]
MSAFEQWLDQAATRGPDRVIPSSVAIAVTKDANDIHLLQLLENGLVDLDADVSSVLPELADPEVFLKFNDAGEPTYEKAIKKITIRMLLTHQSGVGYDFFQPYIQQIRDFKEKAGESVSSKLTWESKLNPLLAQPGKEWSYGSSYELLGRLIERLAHTSLGSYMQTHIWTPLSMSPISFSLSDATLRAPDDSLLPAPNHFYPGGMEFDSGGAGLFAAPSAYGKLLAAILRDDRTLLRPETMAMLFEPQLSPEVQIYFDASVYAEGGEVLSQSLPREAKLTQALGGGVCQADVEGRRRSGTLLWAGLANCYWSVDRVKGVALFWGSQVMPTSDRGVLDGFRRFEEGVYGGLD